MRGAARPSGAAMSVARPRCRPQSTRHGWDWSARFSVHAFDNVHVCSMCGVLLGYLQDVHKHPRDPRDVLDNNQQFLAGSFRALIFAALEAERCLEKAARAHVAKSSSRSGCRVLRRPTTETRSLGPKPANVDNVLARACRVAGAAQKRAGHESSTFLVSDHYAARPGRGRCHSALPQRLLGPQGLVYANNNHTPRHLRKCHDESHARTYLNQCQEKSQEEHVQPSPARCHTDDSSDE